MALNLRLLLYLVLLAEPLLGHGGAYNGPGDGSSGGGGGGAAGTSPPASGATTPKGSGATSGKPKPGGGGAGGTAGPTRPNRPTTPLPSITAQVDTTVWQRWWGFHQHGFLDLKKAIHTSEIAPGSDSFFLGHAPASHARDRLRPTSESIRNEVVPALLAALENERDADVVTGALIALAKIGDGPGESSLADRISPFLSASNQEIAETAAVALGILASPSSEALLRSLVTDVEEGRELIGSSQGVPERTRAFAAYGLGLIAYSSQEPGLRQRIVRTLMMTLDRSARSSATPDLAVACVGAIGLVPLPAEGRTSIMGWSGRESQLAWLESRLGDQGLRDLTRAHVPVAIARVLPGAPEGHRDRVLEVLCERLRVRETPRLIRQGLVAAIGQVTTAGGGPADRRGQAALLEASLSGGDLDLRHYALVALGEVAARPGPGVEPVVARETLQLRLVAALKEGSSLDRPWAALGLGVLGHSRWRRGEELDGAIDELLRRELEKARSPSLVGGLAIACGMRRDSGAVPALIEQLAAVASDDIRGYLCLSLGMLGEPQGLDPVREVVRASRYRPALLRQAAVALGLLGDKHLVPELCATLQTVQSLAAQASVASGLGAIGDARSIGPLTRMLADREITPRARAFAAVALGIVSDKEVRPWNAKLSIGCHYQANPPTLSDGGGAGVLEIL